MITIMMNDMMIIMQVNVMMIFLFPLKISLFCIDAGVVSIYESKERIKQKMRKIHVEGKVLKRGNRVLQF